MTRSRSDGPRDVGLATGVTAAAPVPGGSDGGTREERKARTRRSLLDAALEISAELGFAGTSLRSVTKAAGIVPTAFYRHYASMDELGETLVEESFATLHELMRAIRSEGIAPAELIEGSVDLLAEWVGRHEAHFHFIARERAGGAAAVRESVHVQLELFVTELAADLVVFPPLLAWPERDRHLLAQVIIDQISSTTERLIAAEDPADVIVAESKRQLQMIVTGLENWYSTP